MQRLKSFWRSSPSTSETTITQQNKQQSLLQQASNYISSYRRTQILLTNSDFQQYLDSIPEDYRKFKKNFANRKSAKVFVSLRPELVLKVYQTVQRFYFQEDFQITPQFFQKNHKKNKQKQILIHESLDEVEVALFNQITARFDQILSVLRTVQSLQCLVDHNIDKIKQVRRNNIESTKRVTKKQNNIIILIKKKKNLQDSLQKLNRLKIYSQFLKQKQISYSTNSSGQSNSKIYQSIQQIKKQVFFLTQLKSCQKLNDKIQSTQQDLKRSFSETLNQLIHHYVIGKISPYRTNYWDKLYYKNDILEEDCQETHAQSILDQSTIVEDDIAVDQPKLSLQDDNEELIIKSIARGWNQGEYAVGGLKSVIQKNIKALHTRFLDDFRRFCQNFLKNHDKQVSNPCLQELLQNFTLSFFTKCCSYYSTFFQNTLYRLSSITMKSLSFIIKTSLLKNNQNQKNNQNNQSEQTNLNNLNNLNNQNGQNKQNNQNKQKQYHPLTIEQKEKLTLVLDGMMNVLTFVWKSVNDKFIQAIKTKEISETYEIVDFRIFINVVENLQDFYNKKIIQPLKALEWPKQSFLYNKFEQIKQLLPFQQLISFKNAKLIEYLCRAHKNAIEVELKEKLQNQIWTPTDIPTFYYDSLHYIITGESLNIRRNKGGLRTTNTSTMIAGNSAVFDTSVLMQSMYMDRSRFVEKKPQLSSNFRIIRTEILIQNQTFKVTEAVLLLLQIVEDYMLLNQFYPQIKEQIAIKLSSIFKMYNDYSFNLIIKAKAMQFGKIKTKTITAKQLALSTLCLRFCLFILTSISKRIKLNDLEKIYKDIEQHSETTVKKLQNILKSKVTSSLNDIKLETSPTKGTEAIVNNSKILHDILIDFFDQKTLKKIFIKEIFTLYLQKIKLLKIQSKTNAQTLKDDVNFFFTQLKFLSVLIQNFEEYRIQAQNIVRKGFQLL